MCAPLAHERLDGSYWHLVFNSSCITVQRAMDMNILTPNLSESRAWGNNFLFEPPEQIFSFTYKKSRSGVSYFTLCRVPTGTCDATTVNTSCESDVSLVCSHLIALAESSLSLSSKSRFIDFVNIMRVNSDENGQGPSREVMQSVPLVNKQWRGIAGTP